MNTIIAPAPAPAPTLAAVPEPTPMVSVKWIQQRLAIGRSSTYALTESPGFPEPIGVGQQLRWELAEVEAWIAAQRGKRSRSGLRQAKAAGALPAAIPVPVPVRTASTTKAAAAKNTAVEAAALPIPVRTAA